jgi:hypothetical protein
MSMTTDAPLPSPDLQTLLGYLNFSEGRSDPRAQRQLADAFARQAEAERPWEALRDELLRELERLRGRGGAAFRDTRQAEAVVRLALDEMPRAYRRHHADLLAHQSDADLLRPFFLARACEAVLAQRGPWDEAERVVRGALRQLNDFAGYRPVAVLETGRRGEVYDHERVRPIPLFLRGAGVAAGPYQAALSHALDILRATDPAVLADAGLDPDLLDEFALDPRGYDFGHPAHKRPNFVFGEWDPDHLDNQGRYRRYVARQVTLDALLDRVHTTPDLDPGQLAFEAGAVLAGTVLMATGVIGWGPGAHDSSMTLSRLVPRIARYREAFYARLMEQVPGPHGERLRQEAQVARQPFGGARRHLNQALARHSALQLQQRHLALLFAELGYPAASRRQAARIPVASARMLAELHILLTTGHGRVVRGRLDDAARAIADAEDLLRRSIACGALVDPWNILGFQGQFPRSAAVEDAVRDTRIYDLTRVVDGLLSLCSRVLAEAGARGDLARWEPLTRRMRDLAGWWDGFATTTVGDLPQVRGDEAVRSAGHVAGKLQRWHERGMGSVDLKFWRDQLEGFRTPKAFSYVLDALLEKQDYRAAMGLLMTWLGQAETVPLVEGGHAFYPLALRWMLGVCTALGDEDTEKRRAAFDLVVRFFDQLEANGDEYWRVPRLDVLGVGEEAAPDAAPPLADDEGGLYGAAYEGMTYKDSTDDDVESEVLDVMPQKDFDLKHEAGRLTDRLRFLAALAGLWNLATRAVRAAPDDRRDQARQAADAWLAQARRNYRDLLALMERLHAHEIPRPTGAFESIAEYHSRVVLKEQLLGAAIATGLEQALAVGALQGVREAAEPDAGLLGAAWERTALRLERALLGARPDEVRGLLAEFLASFRHEPLLYTPLGQGGHPHHILRVSLAQRILHGLAHNLPRQGLLRETYELIRTAHATEASQPPRGLHTDFDRPFHAGLRATAEAIAAAGRRDAVPPGRLVEALEAAVEPYLDVWAEHSQRTRLAVLELLQADEDWQRLGDFIRRYGRDLFTPRFLAEANVQGILHRGVGAWLEQMRRDPELPCRLADDLDRAIPQNEAERQLGVILQALLENYDHLKDYLATTAQSDFGDNLYQLFDFLRLKTSYQRVAWQLRPVALVHEVLARRDGEAAALWRGQVEELTREPADWHLEQLAHLEREHGVRLPTVVDRLGERFVKPMAVDRLCALVGPALEQAPERLDGDESCPLEDELRPLAETPEGVGLDVPPWLARLEAELQQARGARTALATLAGTMLHVPAVPLPFEALANQLDDWRQDAPE